jgi:hypothetical protein
MPSGWTVVGLWGRGKLSEMPVLGGLKTESGRVGRDFGPRLRAPTPGEMGGVLRVVIIVQGELELTDCLDSIRLSFFSNTLSSCFPTFYFPSFWLFFASAVVVVQCNTRYPK